MAMFSMILSGLALLAAAIALCATLIERKRNLKRNAALIGYIESHVNEVKESVKKLESGVVPDFEQAKAAANAVNDFNKGISSILGFDPHEAYKRERQKEKNGGDAE